MMVKANGGRQITWLAVLLILASPVWLCAETAEIFTSGVVQPFGSYRVEGKITFSIPSPGRHEIGEVLIMGTYNGPIPWYVRVYTDNTHFQGVSGAHQPLPRGGLVSENGVRAPLWVRTPLSEEQWLKVPDLSDPNYRIYTPSSKPDESNYTELVIMGIDPRNAGWVAGDDKLLYSKDDNTVGDHTIRTPFKLIFSADFSDTQPQGNYTAHLYFEIVAAP